MKRDAFWCAAIIITVNMALCIFNGHSVDPYSAAIIIIDYIEYNRE